MPGRLKTMSVCALLREEKPTMHWQRGKKYLHYKELCLNLGQHLFNWVLFRNISQKWPFKSWKVFTFDTFLNVTSLDIKNKVKLSLIKGKDRGFCIAQTGWLRLSFCDYYFLSIFPWFFHMRETDAQNKRAILQAFNTWTIKFTKKDFGQFKNWSFAKVLSFFVYQFLSWEKIWENWEKIRSTKTKPKWNNVVEYCMASKR